jgi:hypothetical protein
MAIVWTTLGHSAGVWRAFVILALACSRFMFGATVCCLFNRAVHGALEESALAEMACRPLSGALGASSGGRCASALLLTHLPVQSPGKLFPRSYFAPLLPSLLAACSWAAPGPALSGSFLRSGIAAPRIRAGPLALGVVLLGGEA